MSGRIRAALARFLERHAPTDPEWAREDTGQLDRWDRARRGAPARTASDVWGFAGDASPSPASFARREVLPNRGDAGIVSNTANRDGAGTTHGGDQDN